MYNKQKNSWWLKFGCFLTGHNYALLSSCSEASRKTVKKYSSALLIVIILWFLIGVLFSKEYLKLENISSLIAGIILTIIIVQIERQIILGSKNSFTTSFRIILGIVMATLGSVIVDQIIFKEDIEKQKILSVDNEMKDKLPLKLAEINREITYFDSEISKKENERTDLITEITNNPTIRMPKYSSVKTPGKYKKTIVENGVNIIKEIDTMFVEKKYEYETVQNPKAAILSDIDAQIIELRDNRTKLSSNKHNIKTKFEKELLSKKGFLDELKLMFKILTSSSISLFVWALWFFFFLIIELFVLVSKLTDTENDYDKIIKHQMNMRIKALESLNYE